VTLLCDSGLLGRRPLPERLLHGGEQFERKLDRLGFDRVALSEHDTAARQLERVADHAEEMAAIADESDEPVDGALAEPAARARAVVVLY